MSYLPKDYVAVHTRVQQFHEKHPKGSIETTYELLGEDTVVFKATVIIDKLEEGFLQRFNGTSFGSITKDKALEKLETVAVGRALAFAGFETQSGLASKEEMERFNQKQTKKEPQKEKPKFMVKDATRLLEKMQSGINKDKGFKINDKQHLKNYISKYYIITDEQVEKLDEQIQMGSLYSKQD